MDEDTLNGAMTILYIAKLLEGHGKLTRLMNLLGNSTEITWDNQCLVERYACECVFQDTRCYDHQGNPVAYDEYEPDKEVFLLRDPLLDRFAALCRDYEAKNGIAHIENRYARCLENAVHAAMQFGNYYYDYKWIDGADIRQRPRLLLFLYDDFCSYDEIPGALCTILDAYQVGINQLEQELESPATKTITLPPAAAEQKEAA